jgi:hypothetical protein
MIDIMTTPAYCDTSNADANDANGNIAGRIGNMLMSTLALVDSSGVESDTAADAICNGDAGSDVAQEACEGEKLRPRTNWTQAESRAALQSRRKATATLAVTSRRKHASKKMHPRTNWN